MPNQICLFCITMTSVIKRIVCFIKNCFDRFELTKRNCLPRVSKVVISLSLSLSNVTHFSLCTWPLGNEKWRRPFEKVKRTTWPRKWEESRKRAARISSRADNLPRSGQRLTTFYESFESGGAEEDPSRDRVDHRSVVNWN